MGYDVQILADSVSPAGVRLITFEVTFPRLILPEFNTHRAFSRNSASSRAIPLVKMIQRVVEDPFIPIFWGRNQKGMQADTQLSAAEQEQAVAVWLEARDHAVATARELQRLEVHKQIANRVLEPFMWHTVIVTATEWGNFFALRAHADAQPEIQRLAVMMLDAYRQSRPQRLGYDQWHLPLVQPAEMEEARADAATWCNIAVGRCARVSYLTHAGVRDLQADIDLANRLRDSGHMSPFEHVARPLPREFGEGDTWNGNFRGWYQYRKGILGEEDYSLINPQNS